MMKASNWNSVSLKPGIKLKLEKKKKKCEKGKVTINVAFYSTLKHVINIWKKRKLSEQCRQNGNLGVLSKEIIIHKKKNSIFNSILYCVIFKAMLSVQKKIVIWRRQLTNGSQSATKRNRENVSVRPIRIYCQTTGKVIENCSSSKNETRFEHL